MVYCPRPSHNLKSEQALACETRDFSKEKYPRSRVSACGEGRLGKNIKIEVKYEEEKKKFKSNIANNDIMYNSRICSFNK